MREKITNKIAELDTEIAKAEEELARLRPHIQYLEIMVIRLKGASDVLKAMLKEDSEYAEYTR